MTTQVGVTKKGKFSLLDMIKNVKSKTDFQKAGAIALFIGLVRGETLKGDKVQKLELEAYEEKANEILASICNDLKKKQGIVDVQIHHLLGEFSVGEDLVYVLVAGAHRRNVFSVLEEAVERYKKEAPIFKKEYITDEKGKTRAYWVTEPESDI
ncbi:MAG: molybdenum cofactor biosynthesis protein MoaE [Candidatus Bathyarchaeota archaeon]|nr:molybdenum cofactor biosynthesis protein MoaE [Candidatus Bathyarchaeota archaeon]